MMKNIEKKTISLVTFQEHKDEHNTVNNRNPKKSMIFFFSIKEAKSHMQKRKNIYKILVFFSNEV
jgi:hypothetical protein